MKLHECLDKGIVVYEHFWDEAPLRTVDFHKTPQRYTYDAATHKGKYIYPIKTEDIGPSVWEVEMKNTSVGQHLCFAERDTNQILHFSYSTGELLFKAIQEGRVEITSDGWLKLLIHPVRRGGMTFWAPWNE